MKKFVKVLMCLLLSLCLFSCMKEDKDDIVIIYTNDVHCGLDDDIGYAGLISYKNEVASKTKYVALVDAGDAVQGSSLATVSKGEALIECLNVVGYDVLTFGNHEFDYGYQALEKFITESKSPYINCNVVYTGKDENSVLNSVDKYKIMQFGDKKVAFIGILTPNTAGDTSPVNLQQDGEYVINFYDGGSQNDFFPNIQKYVDECKSKGADYVIALAHLGSGEAYEPFSSDDLAKNTNGIDAIVDAHSHSTISSRIVKNKDDKSVLIASTGTKLNNIGQLVIGRNGFITATNIEDYPDKDENVAAAIKEISDRYTAVFDEVLFVSNTPLSIFDSNGIRVIRSQEMPIGDMVADAYRYTTGADIAIVNGGGVRADLSAGDVTFNSIMTVSPFGNLVCAIELTGQEIVDYLEYTYRFTQTDYAKDGNNICEYGSFMQLSGLKCTIDISVTSNVTVDDNDMLLEVGDPRRVKDVMVLTDNAIYEPIDLNKTYVVSSNNYTLLQGGSGTKKFFAGKKVVINDAGEDYKAIYTYITEYLKNDLSRYSQSDERITIK